MCFNPIDEFSWIKEKVVDADEDRQEIVSNYLDNPFLSQDYIKTLKALKKQDFNYWRIYTKGEWGRLENLIYSNWEQCDAMPEGGDIMYGLDFGYNNPSVLVKLLVKDDEIWEEQIIYESGLTNQDLIHRMDDLAIDKSAEIYADSEEPSRIEEIYRAGYNVHPAEKKRAQSRMASTWLKESGFMC
jgi:phage terminase large subunit